MKKIALLVIPFLFIPFISTGETYFLKLRTNHHPDFLRIVLEGHESIVNKAMVYQRGQGVLVTFPDTIFSIQTEKIVIPFDKTDRNTVIFYPGDLRGLKVFTLKHPDRLVVDVYLKQKKKNIPSLDLPPKRKKKIEPLKIKTIIIDPGHGGYENGIVKDKYREKSVVLDIARKLRALINRGSSRSFLTRGSDRSMSQGERVKFANSKDADIFMSIHIGNHGNIVIYVPVVTEKVSDIVQPHLANRGQEEYIEETITLLNAVKEAVISKFGDDMVTVKPLPYGIVSKIESAALLIELPSFEDAYYSDELKTEMANTLYKGLYIYEEIKTK
jgi:N-acetylmuramoyl-L-alanine amidase